MATFELKPTLRNEFVRIHPLQSGDFETLYAVASDPLIWEQHPNPDRYKRDVFETFFKGAMESGAAFLVFDQQSGKVIGSSRYYELDKVQNSVAIGYTFLDRNHWGGIYNPALKTLMMEHAFQFVNRVIFHIGATNIRSQKAIERLGAKKISEVEMEYYGEANRLNFVYCIEKQTWKEDQIRK
ncbi:MAG: family N-acetyltransferase [Bacteroidota bacterium]|jgi:RimJ/RimL family protein N-acetyltransferase|nr:family N-acetyltransferase [Bacteroidota bacterium]